MLINLRNALMAGKRLPYDAEVEFLESTGTQWIDTGYAFNSASDKVELVFELLTTTPNYKWIFGAYDASKRLAIGSGDSESRRTFGYNASTSYNSSTYYTNGAHIFLADSTGASIDGRNFFGFADFSTTSHILLYTIPLNPSEYCSNARIRSYKHYRNGTLVRDYIPVRKGTVGYLYDRVTGKLFGNAGSGDFVLGPDVVPVEYIESHGTEYIDTGVDIANSDDARFVTTCTITNTVANYSSTWVGSGVLSTGGLHYVLDYNGIRTGGGDASMAIPYNRGDVVTIDVYYDSQHRRRCKIGQSIYQGTAYNAQTARLAILNYPAPTDVTSYPCQAGNLFHVEVYKSSTLVRKFLPVRVGTEGAMMDVLTRRIYRNAGTGAFTYGNDLRYPIQAE